MKLLDLLKKRLGAHMSTEIKINTVNGNPLRTYIYKNGVENPDYPITTTGIKNADNISLASLQSINLPIIDLSTTSLFIEGELKRTSKDYLWCLLVGDSTVRDTINIISCVQPPTINNICKFTISASNEEFISKLIYIWPAENSSATIRKIWLEEVT